MAETYGVLGGTDAASLIQRQPGDGHEWKSIARGKLEDVRALASMLNEAELVRALTDGHNDVAMPAGIRIPPGAAMVEAPERPNSTRAGLDLPPAPDFLESNRKALEDEAARPLFPASRREGMDLARRKVPENCRGCGSRITGFGFRLDGGHGFYCPECNAKYPDPAELLERPTGRAINYAMLARLRGRPEALDELRARRWAEGDRILDGKGGIPYTTQGARFLEERLWK